MPLALIIGLAVLCLDQVTKQAIRSLFFYGEQRPVIEGFFNLVYVRNDGAAWNILSGQGIVLILISTIVLIAVCVFHKRLIEGRALNKVLLGLLIGGIAGNLIDRIRFGWVTDFLSFHFGSYEYPSFNVADSAICVVFVVYLVMSFFEKKREAPVETGDA